MSSKLTENQTRLINLLRSDEDLGKILELAINHSLVSDNLIHNFNLDVRKEIVYCDYDSAKPLNVSTRKDHTEILPLGQDLNRYERKGWHHHVASNIQTLCRTTAHYAELAGFNWGKIYDDRKASVRHDLVMRIIGEINSGTHP